MRGNEEEDCRSKIRGDKKQLSTSIATLTQKDYKSLTSLLQTSKQKRMDENVY